MIRVYTGIKGVPGKPYFYLLFNFYFCVSVCVCVVCADTPLLPKNAL